jgi:hypothetical protein
MLVMCIPTFWQFIRDTSGSQGRWERLKIAPQTRGGGGHSQPIFRGAAVALGERKQNGVARARQVSDI